MSEVIWFEGGMVLPDPGTGELLDGGGVVVAGGAVAWVGQGAPDAGLVPDGATRIDARGCVVMPGLVSCHAHSRPFRGLGDGLRMMAWHDRFVHQFSARMTTEDAYAGAAMTFAELLRNGVTTVQVMTSIAEVEDSEVAAALDSGIRARLVPHVAGREGVEATIARIEGEQSARGNGAQAAGAGERVLTWLGLEVPEITADETLALVAEAGARLGVGVHTHFAEFAPGDLDRLEAAGLLRPGLNLAHCVHVSDADIARLAAAGVSVAHNPKSNSRYGNGIAPVRRLLDAGVVVGLGTDGPDSTFSCDVLEEARLAAFLARATGQDPEAMSAAEALALATSGGVAALGLGGGLGRLAEGAPADLVVVDLGGVRTAPVLGAGPHTNVLPVLLFGAGGRDVRDVVVDGRLVVRERTLLTMDEAALVAECERRAGRILGSM
jgi:5-methylthioadenosine/S-adenosylhomocysteine deaminase